MTDGPIESGQAGRVRRALPAWIRRPSISIGVVILGAALLVLAGTLPVWTTHLSAPQYPKGLDVVVYGGRTDGDVGEIHELNHYIGMMPIDLGLVPEIALWPLAILGGALLLVVSVFMRGWLGRLALLALWLIPVTVLADIQRWLIRYGSELDPTAALRLDPFIPLVIGPTEIWNFTVWSAPGPALLVFFLVAALATIARRGQLPERRLRAVVSAATLVAVLAATLFVVIPANQPEHKDAAAGPAPPAGTLDIQGRIAESPAGATVVVPAGTYHAHIVIDRPLTLVAEGEVVIDGDGRGSIITITAADVTVRGFRVRNSGGQVEEAAGIKILADRATVAANHIELSFTGIAVVGAADVAIIGNDIAGSGQVIVDADHLSATPAPSRAIAPDPVASADPHAGHGMGSGPDGQGDGISIYDARRVLIRENRVHGVRDGIYLNFADGALVDTNEIESGRYAVHSMFGSDITVFGNHIHDNVSGLVFMYTHGVLAGRNVIVDQRSPATGFGVALKDVVDVQLIENVIARNRTGIQAEGATGLDGAPGRVLRNRIAANQVGVALMASSILAFGGNAIDGNMTQVLALELGVERTNTWTDGYIGNAWSDYAGYDLAGDGLGDIPYRSGGSAEELVVRDPALIALRASPAFEVLRLAQTLWDAGQTTVVEDPAPITGGTDGLLVPDRIGGFPAGWAALGAALLSAVVAGLWIVVRPAGGRTRLRAVA